MAGGSGAGGRHEAVAGDVGQGATAGQRHGEVELGETLHVTAYVSLGALTPEDVEVQVAHGRPTHLGDELRDVSTVPLGKVTCDEHGRYQFSGDLLLRSSGAFGYTVRVLPRHSGLAHPSSLGLVANA